jgi:PAS domain S-box-containing protein
VISIEKKVRGGFALGIAILVLMALASAWMGVRNISTLQWVTHTQKVIHHADEARASMLESETDARGFVISGDESFLSEYPARVQDARARLVKLLQLTIDNTNQQQRLAQLQPLMRDRVKLLNGLIETRRTNGLAGAAGQIANREGKRIMDRVEYLLDQVSREEERLLAVRAHKARITSALTILLMLFVVVCALALAGVALALLRRDFLRRRLAEEKLAEERNLLRTLFDNLPDYVYVKDRESRHLMNNRANVGLLGAKTVEETIGKSAFDYFPPHIAQQLVDDDRMVLNSGEPLLNREELSMNPQGKPIWLLTTKVPLRDGANNVVGLVGISRDVSDVKHTQEKILALNKVLERRAAELSELNKELETFSYSVSHDLRAPLRHTAGFLALLRNHLGNKVDDEGVRFFDRIAAATTRMGQLIDDLLAFSQMGRAALRHARTDLRTIASQVIKDLTSEMDGRVVNWNIGVLPEVNADPALMRQVLMNLFSNAVKYTRTRERAEIEFQCQKDDARESVFFVRDNGVGFDMQFADKLFGIFERLHDSDQFEGTGIGLANVQRMVTRHGGRTWAEAQVDRGATFYFSIPKTHDHAQTNPPG